MKYLISWVLTVEDKVRSLRAGDNCGSLREECSEFSALTLMVDKHGTEILSESFILTSTTSGMSLSFMWSNKTREKPRKWASRFVICIFLSFEEYKDRFGILKCANILSSQNLSLFECLGQRSTACSWWRRKVLQIFVTSQTKSLFQIIFMSGESREDEWRRVSSEPQTEYKDMGREWVDLNYLYDQTEINLWTENH